MITLFVGENSFELQRALDKVAAAFSGVAEKYDGEELELSQLPDLLLGGTLFASERLIIIKNLSSNKQLWDVLPQWLEKTDSDIHLVLIEPKPDKRTKTFKDLKKHANLQEFHPWSDRDTTLAEAWVGNEAKQHGMSLDRKLARQLVARVGLDQWQLFHAIEKLAVLDTVTSQTIEEHIEANPTENVFNLLDSALRGDAKKVSQMIQTLQLSQDPYMTFGLLSGQVFQLAVLASTDRPAAEIASGIGAHPYALGKLAPHAKRLGKGGTKRLLSIFADTDVTMKSTGHEPWLLIENALVKAAVN